MPISDQEFNGYGGLVNKAPTPVEPPSPYTKSTRTSFGRATAWRRSGAMGISKQSTGSFLSFDDDSSPTVPQSDKGASFGKA